MAGSNCVVQHGCFLPSVLCETRLLDDVRTVAGGLYRTFGF